MTAPLFSVRLGLGTWTMGERRRDRACEVAALRLGLDLGLSLLDTAEMYGEGGAEEVVGEAIAGRRDDVFLVSKVYPHNASFKGTIAACERSLARLRTDRIDLYLLHWRGGVPLADTVGAFTRLQREAKILRWGVSNFDVADLEELVALPGGEACAANQVYFSLGERGVEWSLLPWLRARGMPLMAYSPLGQGRLLGHPALARAAATLGATPAQVALAWLLTHEGVVAVPQSSNPAHIRQIAAVRELVLDRSTQAALETAFPAPTGPGALAML